MTTLQITLSILMVIDVCTIILGAYYVTKKKSKHCNENIIKNIGCIIVVSSAISIILTTNSFIITLFK